jgi:hypothetical protein
MQQGNPGVVLASHRQNGGPDGPASARKIHREKNVLKG